MFQQLFRAATPGYVELHEELADSLAQVGRAEWDAVSAQCSLFLSYPFLASVEESSPTPCSYLLLRDPDGVLVAGLPIYRWNGSRDPGLDHYEPFQAGARWILGPRARPEPWLPTLLAGTRAGYATEFAVRAREGNQRAEIIAQLLRSAARLAEVSGAASLGVMWLTSAAAREALGCILRPEYLVLAAPNCAIEVEWDSFEGYLAQLSWSRRRSVRRERDRFRRSGLRVEMVELSSCIDEVAPLAAQLQRKYGHQTSSREIAGQLQAQARHLNSESRVILCRRQSQLVGFSLLYRWRGSLYARLAGFDYAAASGSDAYFNLAFYLPIQLALDERSDRIELGMATWQAKTLRGASLDPAWTLVCPPVRVRGAWTRAVDRQGESSSVWWAEQFPGQVDWRGDWRWTRSGLAGHAPASVRPRSAAATH
ncbi:MAG TPA: GNAT family N-acetyltransferase [Candidatus Micrarchaeaceae archaeon]|nr:GNAT family N-acetyltransferase [Candidatus Micrarchaeaceae archaeon]